MRYLVLGLVALAIGAVLTLAWGTFCESPGMGVVPSGLGGIVIGVGVLVTWLALFERATR